MMGVMVVMGVMVLMGGDESDGDVMGVSREIYYAFAWTVYSYV